MWPDDDDGGLRIPRNGNTSNGDTPSEDGLIFNFENPGETPTNPRPRINPEYIIRTEPRMVKEGFKLFSKDDTSGQIWGKMGIGLLIMTLFGLIGTLVVMLGLAIYQGMGIWGLIIPPAVILLGYIGYWVGHKTLD